VEPQPLLGQRKIMDFLESKTCKNRNMCRVCRFSEPWRTEQGAPEECPHGITQKNAPIVAVPETDPSILEKAIALASGFGDWAKAGFKRADESQLQSRLDICKGCEFWDQSGFAGTGSCKKCGCSTQAKLRMTTSKCPVDKWGPIEIPIIDVSQ
jgi:hypothetical protein